MDQIILEKFDNIFGNYFPNNKFQGWLELAGWLADAGFFQRWFSAATLFRQTLRLWIAALVVGSLRSARQMVKLEQRRRKCLEVVKIFKNSKNNKQKIFKFIIKQFIMVFNQSTYLFSAGFAH
jgi:hypothetical protein